MIRTQRDAGKVWRPAIWDPRPVGTTLPQVNFEKGVKSQMDNKHNEIASLMGLWITLIGSLVILIQQLASNGMLG